MKGQKIICKFCSQPKKIVSGFCRYVCWLHIYYVMLQVGTAVVTGQNGRLAMGRLGSLCEQVNKYTIEEISKKKTTTIVTYMYTETSL